VRVDKGAGYLMVCESVRRNYFFIFLSSRNQGILFLFSNYIDGIMYLFKKEMKLETKVVVILTQPSYVALK
jgi:hypothetical protein